MRKLFFLSSLLLLVATSGFSQKSEASDTAFTAANNELKTALVNKLKLSDAAATKVIVIENDFYTKLKTIESLGAIPVKDKEIKLNEAHTARRAALIALPLTGRQMEDVVDLSGQTRRSHKL